MEADKDLSENDRQHVLGGMSIIFTRKAVNDETFFESLQTYANQLGGLMVSNFIPFPFVNRVCVNVSLDELGCQSRDR